ncbi:hypothetical protein [Phreatobacter stygius]|uniref:Uncharacterized protein n=1 Tax=Phreatobacter stygius TaxID=1940610 RepID=A0A4D7BBT9_9HYPH|nr:hypothetical protein [Phreatobacter stygius]QCI68113.1 hypothetical protein E8M01_30105 [Phreatobacter stygius]
MTLALLAGLAASLWPVPPAHAQPAPPPATPGEALSPAPAPRAAQPAMTPMTFTRMTGTPGACGQGCSEWIAAEGVILPGTVVTFAALVQQLGTARPPIAIHSEGGLVDVSMALGRIVRRARLDTIVARTERSGETPTLALDGVCYGSCLYLLVAGVQRAAAPGAVISISPIDFRHPAGGALPDALRQKLIAATLERVRGYFGDMGLDPALGGLMDGEQHDAFYPERGILEGYGIITRDQGF